VKFDAQNVRTEGSVSSIRWSRGCSSQRFRLSTPPPL